MSIQNFWQRMVRLFRQQPTPQRAPTPRGPSVRPQPIQPTRVPVVSPQPVVVAPQTPPTGPLDYASVIQLIHQAGRNLKLLQITYDGVSRQVEPYSFREKATGRLFYGYCSIHTKIHSFKPERISHCEITNISYTPRWEVEL